jgi:hypothetical protein
MRRDCSKGTRRSCVPCTRSTGTFTWAASRLQFFQELEQFLAENLR